MKYARYIIPMFAMMAIMVSCSDENDAILLEKETFAPGIEITDSVKVNQTEINNIVEDILSRPQSRQSDYTIETITDDNGKELMYVVNYSNNAGFVVISATKNYYPVLAYNDKGNFNIEGDMPLGLSMWNEGIKENIKYVNQLPSDSVIMYRAMWRKYESPSQMGYNSRSLESDIATAQTILMDSVLRWTSANMTTSDIPQDGIIHREEQSEIEELVMGAIYPSYMDEMYRLSTILHRNQTTEEIVDNFVLSIWNQSGPYGRNFTNGLAGCGPVAAGQIMRYYEYPNTFDWDAMLLIYPTQAISDLLYDIAERAGFTSDSNGTHTSPSSLKNALRSYGYTAEFGNHNPAIIWQNIRSGKPVIMRGDNVGVNGDGHAWVASGGKCITGLIQDEVWTFTGKRTFKCIKKYNTNYTHIYYFYMNWGWGGLHNGIYMDANLISPEWATTITNRQMTYNIAPNV